MKQIKLKRLINNHAFTLVELLAVIIILGVLSSIVISLGMNYINKAKEQAYYLLINSIETTTRLYIDDYRDIIDNIDEPGQEISITLGDLISKEMLTEPVIDPRNDISIPLDTKIYIYVLGNNRYDIKFSYSDENLSSYYLFPKNNLILHLDAANIINLDNGDMVTQWDDLSPKKNHATQSDNSFKPIYKTNILNNQAIVRFANSYLILPNDIAILLKAKEGITLFLVGNKTAHNERNSYIDITIEANNSKIFLDFQANNTLRSGGRSKSENFQNVISANTYTTNNYHIISTTQSLEDNEIKIWINQEKLTTTGTVNFGLNAYNDDFGTRHTIGAAAGKVNYLRGDIAEILLYNTVLNDQKRQQVEQYLNYKWLKH